LGLHVGAVLLFVAWFACTDRLFGHFQGPPELLIGALAAASLGLAASSTWFGLWLLRRRLAGPEITPRSSQAWWLDALLRAGHSSERATGLVSVGRRRR